MKLRSSFFAFIALLFLASAQAATPINQLKPLDADGAVSIDNVQGRIVVRTWARPEVKITGSLGQGVEKLIVAGDRRRLRIEVKYPQSTGGWGWWGSGKSHVEPTLLEVTLPAKAEVNIESVSAGVDVHGASGRRLAISSVSGDVTVASAAPGEASIETVSGSATLQLHTARTKFGTVSGDVRLEGRITGEVAIESVSGDVVLVTGVLRRMEFSTVSGVGRLQVALAEDASLQAESVSGDIWLTVPATTSARLALETFSGDIQSSAGRVDREEFAPGKRLNARLGEGDASIKIESFSGDVHFISK